MRPVALQAPDVARFADRQAPERATGRAGVAHAGRREWSPTSRRRSAPRHCLLAGQRPTTRREAERRAAGQATRYRRNGHRRRTPARRGACPPSRRPKSPPPERRRGCSGSRLPQGGAPDRTEVYWTCRPSRRAVPTPKSAQDQPRRRRGQSARRRRSLHHVSGRLGPPFAMLRSSAGNWPSGAPSTPSSTPVIVSHRHVTTHLTSGRLLWPPRASPTRSARSALFRSRNEARAADAGREAVARGLGFRKRSARSRDGSELHEQAQHVGRRPALDHPPVSEVQHRLPGHREAGTGRRDPHEHAVVGAALGEP